MVNAREKSYRMRIVIVNEETGEELTTVGGVETLVLLAAPDAVAGRAYRRILIGDAEVSAELLFDVWQDLTGSVQRGTVLDLSGVIDDQLLLTVTEGLPRH